MHIYAFSIIYIYNAMYALDNTQVPAIAVYANISNMSCTMYMYYMQGVYAKMHYMWFEGGKNIQCLYW